MALDWLFHLHEQHEKRKAVWFVAKNGGKHSKTKSKLRGSRNSVGLWVRGMGKGTSLQSEGPGVSGNEGVDAQRGIKYVITFISMV